MTTPLGLAILAAWLAVQAAQWWVDALNLQALSPSPPAGFEDLYDRERYSRSQAYARARLRFGFSASAVSLSVLLLFWGFGGFGALDGLARSAGLGPVPTGLIYLGCLGALRELASLPFAAWSTFVIESRFGFNRTTVRTFVLDRLKGYGLALAIGGPVLALVLHLFGRLGAGAWVWVWAAVTAVSLVLQFVAPSWILPLFNTFTPLPEGDLRRAVFDLARRTGYPLGNVFVMDGSRRSAKGNAFFTGFGRHKRIALFDTLVERNTVPELVAVLAHEIGHHKMGHIWKGFALGTLRTGVSLFLLSLTLQWAPLFEAFGSAPSPHVGLVVFGILLSPLSTLTALPVNAYSRRNEFEADRYAKDILGSGADLVRALRKLSADSLSNLTPHPAYVRLHYTHPPLVQRVGRLTNRPS